MTTTTIKLRKGFRMIPGYSNYAINRDGEVYNINTGNTLNVHDNDHWSGRVTLYKSVKGESVKNTRNICSLIMDAFNLKSDTSIRNRLLTD